MNKVALIGGKIYSGDAIFEQKALLTSEGKIDGIVHDHEIPSDYEIFNGMVTARTFIRQSEV